jgi:hypothetical protein
VNSETQFRNPRDVVSFMRNAPNKAIQPTPPILQFRGQYT